jgi:hypothetical protein
MMRTLISALNIFTTAKANCTIVTVKEHDPVGYNNNNKPTNKPSNNNKTSLNSITMSFQTGFQASTRH